MERKNRGKRKRKKLKRVEEISQDERKKIREEERIEAWVRVNVEKKLAKEDNHIGWVMANSDSIFNGKTNGIMSHEKTVI